MDFPQEFLIELKRQAAEKMGNPQAFANTAASYVLARSLLIKGFNISPEEMSNLDKVAQVVNLVASKIEHLGPAN